MNVDDAADKRFPFFVGEQYVDQLRPRVPIKDEGMPLFQREKQGIPVPVAKNDICLPPVAGHDPCNAVPGHLFRVVYMPRTGSKEALAKPIL